MYEVIIIRPDYVLLLSLNKINSAPAMLINPDNFNSARIFDRCNVEPLLNTWQGLIFRPYYNAC